MANRLRSALIWLNSQLDNSAADDGLYRCLDGSELTFPMTVGSTESTRESSDGMTVEMVIDDVTFTASRLVVDGTQREPSAGDEIEISLGGIVRKLEITSPGGSVPPWEWSDPYKTRCRVHVREIEDISG